MGNMVNMMIVDAGDGSHDSAYLYQELQVVFVLANQESMSKSLRLVKRATMDPAVIGDCHRQKGGKDSLSESERSKNSENDCTGGKKYDRN